jgi:molybdopterin synthase sulfur carrier subunit
MTESVTATRPIRLVYFAWVRERIGCAEETLSPPAEAHTILDLVRWLKTRGEGYEAAFANENIVRAAIDHAHVRPDAALAGAREIAFFPPMTGG